MSTRPALLLALLVALAGAAGAVLVLGGRRPGEEGSARAFYQLVGGPGVGSADPDAAPVLGAELFCPPALFAGSEVWKAEARETQSKELRTTDP